MMADRMTPWFLMLAILGAISGSDQASTACKNCSILGKEEKSMFRAHSDACLTQSQVDPRLIDAMLGGELVDDPALKRHVYCVLIKCKIVGKDGKLQKSTVMGHRDVVKVLDSCADRDGDTPEDVAWNFFRCGYNKKSLVI